MIDQAQKQRRGNEPVYPEVLLEKTNTKQKATELVIRKGLEMALEPW